MKKILLLLLLPLFCLGQQKTIKEEGDIQNGKGERIYLLEDGTKISQKGTFKNGRLEGENGEEERINKNDTIVFKGEFKEGELIEGSILRLEEDRVFYKGTFKKNNLFGTNCSMAAFTKSGDTIIKYGRFINGTLIDGSYNYKKPNGWKRACKYQNGEEINCIRNDRNHYNSDDIIGGSSSKIMLQTLDNEAYIEIGFDNTKTNLLWDTGAYGLALSKYDFIKLLESGVEFLDLNLKAVSYGVANIPIEGKTLIINNLKIGEYTVNNVVCTYYPNMKTSLIGMNFFDKFDNVKWDKKNEYLILYK